MVPAIFHKLFNSRIGFDSEEFEWANSENFTKTIYLDKFTKTSF